MIKLVHPYPYHAQQQEQAIDICMDLDEFPEIHAWVKKKKNQSQNSTTVWFHLFNILEMVKIIEMEKSLVRS